MGSDGDQGGPDDGDAAFVRLREVLGAPDRHGWRGRLGSLRPGHGRAPDDEDAGADGVARSLRLVALPILGAAVIVLVGALRPGVDAVPAGPPAEVIASPTTPGPVPDDRDPSSASAVPRRLWPGPPVSVDGNVVRRGDERWVVGAPGDVVVVGDWDCDLEPTPAVLRPRTGGFYVFDGWADGPAAPARRVTQRPGSVAAEARGCGVAVLRDGDGVGHEVPTDRAGA